MPRFHSRLQMWESEWNRKSVVFLQRFLISNTSFNIGEILRSSIDRLGYMCTLYTLHTHMSIYTLYTSHATFSFKIAMCESKSLHILVKGQLLPKLIMRLGTCMGNTPLGIAFVCLLHLFVYFVCCGSIQDQHPTGHHMINMADTCGCTQTPKNIKLDSSGISVGQLAGGQVARRQQLLSLFCCPLSAVTLTLTLS